MPPSHHPPRRAPEVARRAALGAVLAAGLAACSASPDSSGTAITGPGGGTTPDPNGPAHVRLVQVVSDAARGVDVRANGQAVLGALPFGAVFPSNLLSPTQTEYQGVPAGTQLAFTATGSAAPFYDRAPSALTANAYATVIMFGRLASSGQTAATAVALSDTNANAPAGVLVRVFNTVDYVTAGVGTPVDVYIYPQRGARPATPDVTALPWGERSRYVGKAADTLRVDVFAARPAGAGTPLFSGTVPAGAGSVRTLVLADPPAGSAGAPGSVVALYDVR